jgi:hypothetical protein
MRTLLTIALAAGLWFAGDAHASSPAGEPATGKVVHLFGSNFCIGTPPAGERCDHRLPDPRTPAAAPTRFTLLGKTFCLGNAADGRPCDVRLPVGAAPPADARRGT